MLNNVQKYDAIALISHASKVVFKIFQGRLQQYMNQELPDVKLALSLRKLREIVKNRESWHAAVHGVTKSPTQLSSWTTRVNVLIFLMICDKCTKLVQGLARLIHSLCVQGEFWPP